MAYKKKKNFKKNNKNSGKQLALKALKKESLSSMFRHYIDNSRVARLLKYPIPDGLRTVLRCEWQAVEAVASTASYTFNVKANSPWLPFNVTGFSIGGTALLAPPGTAIGEAGGSLTTTKQCAGLNKLMGSGALNTLFDAVAVIGSKIKVYYHPESLSDTMEVSITPQRNTDSGLLVNVGKSDILPNNKYKLITTSVPGMYCSNYVNLPKFQGESPKDYVSSIYNCTSLNNGAITSPGQDNMVFWTVNRQCLNGTAVSAQGLPYKVEVEYDCVFKRLATADMQIIG